MSDETTVTDTEILVCLDVLETAREFYDDVGVTHQLSDALYIIRKYKEELEESGSLVVEEDAR